MMLLLNTISAQNQHIIDSLQNLLHKFETEAESSASQNTQTNDQPINFSSSVKADILYQLSKAYWVGNLDKAMDYAKQVEDLSKKINYTLGLANAYNSIGVVYYYKGNYAIALEYNLKALKLREELGNKKDIAASNNNIGLIFDERGSFTEALKYYLLSLKLYDEINDKDGKAQALNNIGLIYRSEHNNPKAIEYLLNSLVLRKEIKDDFGLTESYSNIGLIYYENGMYDSAIWNYNAALDLRKKLNDKQGIAISYNNFGDLYKKQGKLDKALFYFNNALKLHEEGDYKIGIIESLNNLSSIYQLQNNLNDALKMDTMALSMAKKIGAVDYLKKLYGSMSGIYFKKKNFEQAYLNEVLFKAMNDSLYNSDKGKTITKLEMEYDFGKKQAALKAEQENKDNLAEASIQKQRIILYSFVSGFVLVLLLTFVLYKRSSEKQKANEVLKNTLLKLRTTQQQLIVSEKKAAFGELANRMAHEIQNPLNFVNNFAELSKELAEEILKIDNDDDREEVLILLKDNLMKISHHGKRASDIISKLQEHTRAGTAHEFFEEENK